MRRTGATTAICLLLAAGPSPRAAVGSPHGDLRAEAFASLGEARRLLEEPMGLEEALETAARAAGMQLAPPNSPTAAGPATLPAPVRSLLAAIGTAEAGVDASLHANPDETRAAARAAIEALRTGGPGSESVRRWKRWTARNVDAAGLASAARDLAAAVDGAVATLPHASPTRERAVGCDVFSLAGVLCIGGGGANVYDRDYQLLIDLGGDDVHTHSAGGGHGNVIGRPSTVAVTIDLDGNDVYRASVPSPGGSLSVMGSASVGIGILVDGAGNDTYEGTAGAEGSISALGVGVAGVGVFRDIGGNDRYRASSAVPLAERTFLDGFGWSILGGTSLFLEDGGDDAYTLEALPRAVESPDSLGAGGISAFGFGASVLAGPSVFVDRAGDDTLDAISRTAQVAPEDPRPLAGSPDIYMLTGGHGFEGYGFALTGTGPTRWRAIAEGRSGTSAAVELDAFGLGITGGLGALFDAGGDDTYEAIARADLERTATWHPGCGCSGAEAYATGTGDVWIHGLGSGWASAGLLVDAGGNDRYVASAEALARAHAEDPRTSGSSALPSATADAQPAHVHALGHGYTGGLGVLSDEAGDDVYIATGRSIAEATTGGGRPGEAGASTGGAVTEAMGFGNLGAGELLDGGGADTYTATNTSSATMNGEVVPGGAFSFVLGVGDLGEGWVLDAGGTDQVTISPPFPACHGTTRGQGAWIDCSQGAGGGLNT